MLLEPSPASHRCFARTGWCLSFSLFAFFSSEQSASRPGIVNSLLLFLAPPIKLPTHYHHHMRPVMRC